MIDRSIVDAWIQWVKCGEWDFFVTLNFNCESNIVIARRHFRRFCQQLDRRILGVGWDRDISRRTDIVAMPEHLSANFHFHCLIKQNGNFSLPAGRFETHIKECWVGVIGSGSCDVQSAGDPARRATYMSKELWKNEVYEAFLVSPESSRGASSSRSTLKSPFAVGSGAPQGGRQTVREYANFSKNRGTKNEETRPDGGVITPGMEASMGSQKSNKPEPKALRYFDVRRRKIARYFQKYTGSNRCRKVISVVEQVARRLNGSRWWREQFEYIADQAGVLPVLHPDIWTQGRG